MATAAWLLEHVGDVLTFCGERTAGVARRCYDAAKRLRAKASVR